MKSEISRYIDEWEQEMLALVRARENPASKPAPRQSDGRSGGQAVVAGPWPTPKLSEQEIIRRQEILDAWWERHREEEERRSREPTPDQKLTQWIWGSDR
jgi:hypothetical protein